jgi:hypothetical protein
MYAIITIRYSLKLRILRKYILDLMYPTVLLYDLRWL